MSALAAKPDRVLVVVLRRLGDVLLTTPLLRSLRRGLPGASIDVLVFAGTEGMLAGNPDIDHVIAMPQRSSPVQALALVRRLWRRYDLAITTQTGDRPTFLAWLAGRRRIGLAPDAGQGGWWKRRALHRAVAGEPEGHRVVELLRIASALGLAPQPELVPPTAPSSGEAPARGRYAVLHANPMFRYKRWTDAGWRGLARALAERGLQVIATGGPDPAERTYLDGLWNEMPRVERVDGKLGWPELTALLRGAAVYVGTDTSMTHLAAAAGCPTVALYGPVSPQRIGPWPVGGLGEMWAAAGTIQRRGNVWVVQNPLPCLPCEKLGCEGHLDSHAQCLDELGVRQVLVAVDQALGGVAPGGVASARTSTGQ